jgi:hypothetical protein
MWQHAGLVRTDIWEKCVASIFCQPTVNDVPCPQNNIPYRIETTLLKQFVGKYGEA